MGMVAFGLVSPTFSSCETVLSKINSIHIYIYYILVVLHNYMYISLESPLNKILKKKEPQSGPQKQVINVDVTTPINGLVNGYITGVITRLNQLFHPIHNWFQ